MKLISLRHLRLMLSVSLSCLLVLSGLSARAEPVHVAPVDGPLPADLRPVAPHLVGRVAAVSDEGQTNYVYQWPGLYFESAFVGDGAYFRVGKGDQILKIEVDGELAQSLMRPAPGLYAVTGLTKGLHQIRIDSVSENQSGPVAFGGFYLRSGALEASVPARSVQMEFIGDSWTVGYGNTAGTHDCTTQKVWETTDNSQGFPARVAAHFHADYRVHAISGRGIVRNYGGFVADPVPNLYDYSLFDKANAAADKGWSPSVIVIGLGSNDFSTPLVAGEPFADRPALQSAYEARFERFITALHARHPAARIVMVAPNPEEGEIASEIHKTYARLKAEGVSGLSYVAFPALKLEGCHWHPSVVDDETMADTVIRALEALAP